MKVEVKKVDELRHELTFEIPQDRVSQKLNDVYGEIAKVAKVKGFRKGKVPRHVLEKSHGDVAQEEMIKNVITETYQEGIVQEKLDPIDLPEIHDVNYKDGIVKYTAKLDIRPSIEVKDYKGMNVKRKSNKVTDEEIEKTLEFFKQGKGKDKEVKIDDDFAKTLGYPSLDEFKQNLARQMEFDKDRQNRMDVENQIIDELIKKIKFQVPQSLVHKQLHYRIDEMKHHWKQHQMSDEEIQKKAKEAHDDKELAKVSERDVRAYLIFQKIAEAENIEVKEGESLMGKVMELLLKEAKWEETK